MLIVAGIQVQQNQLLLSEPQQLIILLMLAQLKQVILKAALQVPQQLIHIHLQIIKQQAFQDLTAL